MTLSTSRASYEDCFELFDQALEKADGIRVSAFDHGAAYHLFSRLQYARTLHRAEATEIYEPSQPEFGISIYDTLIVRRPRERDGRWWVYIEPRKVIGEVEELKAAE